MTGARSLAVVLAAMELPIVLVMAPLLLFPTAGRLSVLALVPLVLGSAWVTTRRVIPPTPFNAAIVALLVMVGVSLFVTFDVQLSLGKVSGVILGALLFWALCRWVNSPHRLALAVVVFVGAGVVLALIGLFGTDYSRFASRFPGDPGKFPLFAAISRRVPQLIVGIPGAEAGFNPNAVAGSLVLFIPLQVALLVGRAHRWLPVGGWSAVLSRLAVPAQVLFLCVTAGGFALMQSRGAFLGLLVALAAFLMWYRPWTRRLALVIGSVVLVVSVTVGPDGPVGRLVKPIGTGLVHTVTVRYELWMSGVAGIRDYPLTGMGMNTFRKIMPVRYPIATDPQEERPHVHNHLLQAALDLGIPGLLAYLAIWGIAARELVRVYRNASDPAHALIAGGLGAGLVASFVFGIADAIPLGAKVGVLFWMTLACVASLRRVALPA